MYVQCDNIKVSLNEDECRTLYHALRRDVEDSIKTHFVNYPQCYEEQAAHRLHMMKVLAGPISELFEYHKDELAKLLATVVAGKTTSTP